MREINGYYEPNIKTSRNEDSVYAMKYASQQMLINKLQQENQQLREVIDKLELENKILKEQMVAMVKPNYTYGIR